MNVRKHVVIKGRVQGVNFRSETENKANELGVTGWVMNRRDGSLEAVFEGAEEAVERMLEWCRQGPPLAKVVKIDVDSEKYTGKFNTFERREPEKKKARPKGRKEKLIFVWSTK